MTTDYNKMALYQLKQQIPSLKKRKETIADWAAILKVSEDELSTLLVVNPEWVELNLYEYRRAKVKEALKKARPSFY